MEQKEVHAYSSYSRNHYNLSNKWYMHKDTNSRDNNSISDSSPKHPQQNCHRVTQRPWTHERLNKDGR